MKACKIKAIQDYQLVNMRTINTDPRAPSHDMAGLRSTYSFETELKSTKTNVMWKRGQVPKDVNTMPGLVLDESDNEESHEECNAMQNGDGCFFCKKTGHQRQDCRKYE